MITIILCKFILTGTNKNWGIHIFFLKITLMSIYLDWYFNNYFMSIYLDWYEQKLGYPYFFVKITLMSIYLDWYFYTIILCQFIWTGTNRNQGINIFFVIITLMSIHLDWYFINDNNDFMSIYLT